MKKLTLILMSIVAGLLLGRYYSLIPRKLLLDYLVAACMTFGLIKLTNNNEGILITVQEIFQ